MSTENQTARQQGYFVKVPMEAGLRIMQEVGSAFKLFLWLVGRVTTEYQADGFRVGAVLGFGPNGDESIARDLARLGVPASHDKVCRWRSKLAARGLICQKRTPYGYRVGVMHSGKFPLLPAQKLPGWARRSVDIASARLMRHTHNSRQARDVKPLFKQFATHTDATSSMEADS